MNSPSLSYLIQNNYLLKKEKNINVKHLQKGNSKTYEFTGDLIAEFIKWPLRRVMVLGANILY